MIVITLFIGHCGAFRAKMKILARLPTRVIVQTFLFSQIKALQSDNRVYVLGLTCVLGPFQSHFNPSR